MRSAEALADDLRKFIEQRPILAHRVSSIEKASRWCPGNPLAAASLAAVALIFLTDFVLVSVSYLRPEKALREEARLRREAQERETAERWNRYRAEIVASAIALQVYNVAGARQSLESSPGEYNKNWEWKYFYNWRDLAEYVFNVLPPSTTDFGTITPGVAARS